jgi:tyrosyl-tRNA synthetase
MKREMHPMQAKKDLARRIVADFHSADAAAKAAEDWAKQFQTNEVPEELEAIEIHWADVMSEGRGAASGIHPIGGLVEDSRLVRVDKLIRQAGLATSNTAAAAKIKSGAVSIAGENIGTQAVIVSMPLNQDIVLRVGRRMKRVRIVSNGDKPM